LTIDQYDTKDTVYFVTFDKQGSVEASVRANPSVCSSLLADYFPHLIESGDAPRADNIYEISRFIVPSTHQTREAMRKAKSRLFCILIEWLLERDVSYFQTVIDACDLAAYVEITSHTRILGLAHPFGDAPHEPGSGECIALRWPVSALILQDVRDGYGDATKHSPEFPRAPADKENPDASRSKLTKLQKINNGFGEPIR
jgi:N-acyl-L-homoserine lactone synthetase